MPKADELGVLSVEKFLSEILNIEGDASRNEMALSCPDPDHNDEHPSCYINLTSGLWVCFSCGAAGDLVGLTAVTLGIKREKALRLVKPHEPDAIVASVQSRIQTLRSDLTPKTRKQRKTLGVPPPSRYADGPLAYLHRRGFTDCALRKWGIKYVRSERIQSDKDRSFKITHSIAIPVHDEDGKLHGWQYRRTDRSESWQPKYLNSPGMDLAQYVFGLNHHADLSEIVVVEGPLDAVWMGQHGIPAVALLGSQSKNPQRIEKLARYSHVTIFPDRDEAGFLALDHLGSALQRMGVPVTVARYPSFVRGNDPQEVSGIDLELMLHRTIPYLTWRMNRK